MLGIILLDSSVGHRRTTPWQRSGYAVDLRSIWRGPTCSKSSHVDLWPLVTFDETAFMSCRQTNVGKSPFKFYFLVVRFKSGEKIKRKGDDA